MILTGERVIPELMNPRNGLLREHIARYRFAAKLAYGRILDIACGVGYGTNLLIKECKYIKHILGVDIDRESIDYARKNYSHIKSAFLARDALMPNFADEIGLYDTIISFETIEHVEEEEVNRALTHSMFTSTGKKSLLSFWDALKNFKCITR